MKIRSLLLDSSAILAVVGGAQAAATGALAADTVVKPAPINYVQICDAYGIGYFLIPGQADTCLRIQGQIQLQLNFHTRDSVFNGATTSGIHSAEWETQALGQMTFTAQRQTDHGPLIGVVRLTATSGTNQNIQSALATSTSTTTISGCTPLPPATSCTATTTTTTGGVRVPIDRYAQVDRVWLQLGAFHTGYDASIYGIGTTKQADLEWKIGGYGVAIGVDDPRDRWGSRLPQYYWQPDLVADITATPTWGTVGIGFGLSGVQLPQSAPPNGTFGKEVWGVAANTTINTPRITKGDQIALSGAVGTGCGFVVNNCGSGTSDTLSAPFETSGATMWTAAAQFKHILNSAWNVTGKFQWFDPNPAAERWQATGQLVWQGITNFQVQTQVVANQTTGATGTAGVVWTGQVQLQWQY